MALRQFEPLDFTRLSGSTSGGTALSGSRFRTSRTTNREFSNTGIAGEFLNRRRVEGASRVSAAPSPVKPGGFQAPTAGGGGTLPDTLAAQRREIEDSIQQAFEANLLSEAEKNSLLTKAREEIEAQIEQSRKRLVESGFGRANIGAVRRELIGLEGTRIGEIAGARRDINQLQLDRARDAAEGRVRSLTDIQSLPPEGFSREALNISQGSRLPTSTLRERLLQDILASRERFGLSTAT